ncbi:MULTISPECIES: hypothetical protein [unclassified Carboxylicivirga]|uniref:hypothetical protein n=1 Tax=Carboxylicivirga TaxID=1628153 RepID=UPI003D32E909
MKIFVRIYLLLSLALPLNAQLSEVPQFMEARAPLSALITDYEHRDSVDAHSALVRLPNRKVALMTREKGKMEPFFIKAIETGYWDTRYDPNTDYDVVFDDMRAMGANTAYVMLHWEDIEKSDNVFDFTFADSIEQAAQRQGLKLKWILFLHAQFNGVPSHNPETAWTFHLDDRDGKNYAMQWPKRKGMVFNTIEDVVKKDGIRPLHVYGHPEVFYRIRRMLYRLAVHYRHSKTLIGVQIGNEEGFSFLDESDHNPVTAALYEDWKLKTNKSDYALFKREAMNWWWQQFTSAYHEGDPYKILSFNLDAGQAEAGDVERVSMTGTSAATYGDGNLDAIGTMFYKQWGYQAFDGLDQHYNLGRYNYQLPLLIPSEIGIGRFNSARDYTNFVMHTLERGGQGFGVYCYGEVRKELADTSGARLLMSTMFENIRLNEDIIYEGLPGPGSVYLTSAAEACKISHLNVDGGATLAMVYFPQINPEAANLKKGRLSLKLRAVHKGRYKVSICQGGKVIRSEKISMMLSL